MAKTKAKSKAKKTDTLGETLRQRVEEFSDPDKFAKLWARTQGELGKAIDGGAKIGEALGQSILSSGLHAGEGINAAIKRRTSDLQKLRSALVNGRIDAQRFATAWKQVNETAQSRYAAIKEKGVRETLEAADKALDEIVGIITTLPFKILGIGG